jgi:CelD/BcsL family acetyltransferase involved in cellulose biosynthesis
MTSPTYEIREHHRFDTVAREAWDALYAASRDASVFQQYGWARSWWECCAPPASEACILTAEHGGRIVALAPFYLQKPSADSERAQLRFLGGYHNDYQLYLVHPDHTDAYDHIHRYLLRRLPVGEIMLNEVPRTSLLHDWLSTRGRRTLRLDPTPCPMLRFDLERDIEGFLNRKSLRRKENRLNGLGLVEVDHRVGKDAIRDGLPLLFEQHERRWHATEYPSHFRHEAIKAFYMAMVDALPAGVPVLTQVRVRERVIACHLGFRSGSDLLWYKPAYEPDYARYSPGEFMIAALIRYAHDQGCRTLDFTRGDEAFKRRFSNHLHWNENFVVYPSSTRFGIHKANRALRLTYRRVRERALNRGHPQRTPELSASAVGSGRGREQPI